MENELEILKKQGINLLKKYYNPHCQIIINFDGIKITSDEMFIPNEENLNKYDKLKEIENYVNERFSFYFDNCKEQWVDDEWSNNANDLNAIRKIIEK